MGFFRGRRSDEESLDPPSIQLMRLPDTAFIARNSARIRLFQDRTLEVYEQMGASTDLIELAKVLIGIWWPTYPPEETGPDIGRALKLGLAAAICEERDLRPRPMAFHRVAINALVAIDYQLPEGRSSAPGHDMCRGYCLWAGDYLGRAGRDRAADVVFGATVPEPGTWAPHALVEQDEGGPGKLLIGPRGPIFVTNSGITHDYGWAWFKRFTVDEASGEISIQTDSGQLAVIPVRSSG